MTKTIVQFAFKQLQPHGLPTIDCRVLPNPYQKGIPDTVLRERVRALPNFEDVVNAGVELLSEKDKIWVGCLYGRHRSVAVAEEIAKRTGATVQSVVQA